MSKLIFFIFSFFLSLKIPLCQLSFCNYCGEDISLSVGYYESGDWYSEGWWNPKPGSCVTVIAEDLKYTKYYFFARSTSGKKWKGDFPFCTKNDVFKLQDGNCIQRGKDIHYFREINVGDSREYSVPLTSGTNLLTGQEERGGCNNFSNFSNSVAKSLTTYLDKQLVGELFRKGNISIGEHSRLQFAIAKNGNARYTIEKLGKNARKIKMTIPMKTFDARIDTEVRRVVDFGIGSKSVWTKHHEDISDFEFEIEINFCVVLTANKAIIEKNDGIYWSHNINLSGVGAEGYGTRVIEDKINIAFEKWKVEKKRKVSSFTRGCAWKNSF